MGTDAGKYSSGGHNKGGRYFKFWSWNRIQNFGYLIADLQDFNDRLLSSFVVCRKLR